MDKPFTTDGCSGVADLDMGPCCFDHDLAYWKGGSPEDRIEADVNFRLCIQAKSKFSILAWPRFLGVRLFGVWWLPTPFRWGYGWDWPRHKE